MQAITTQPFDNEATAHIHASDRFFVFADNLAS